LIDDVVQQPDPVVRAAVVSELRVGGRERTAGEIPFDVEENHRKPRAALQIGGVVVFSEYGGARPRAQGIKVVVGNIEVVNQVIHQGSNSLFLGYTLDASAAWSDLSRLLRDNPEKGIGFCGTHRIPRSISYR
jgi:hypothetical protein